MAKWKWTEPDPKGPASEPVQLVCPDGTLAGVTLKTLQDAWGCYLDGKRADVEKRIIRLLNEGMEHG